MDVSDLDDEDHCIARDWDTDELTVFLPEPNKKLVPASIATPISTVVVDVMDELLVTEDVIC